MREVSWWRPTSSIWSMLVWSVLISGVVLFIGVVTQQRFSGWMVLASALYGGLALLGFASMRFLAREIVKAELREQELHDSGLPASDCTLDLLTPEERERNQRARALTLVI